MANWVEIKEIVLDNGDNEGYFVSITLRNLTGKKISCKVPKGQIFENESIYEKTQNLAAREEYLYNFSEDAGYKRLAVPAYCLNHAMLPPNGKAGKITIFEVMFKDFENQDQLWRLIDRQNMLINPEGFSSNSKPDLLKSLIHASAQLQGLGKTMKQDEDSRNGFISAVLNNKGHKAKGFHRSYAGVRL